MSELLALRSVSKHFPIRRGLRRRVVGHIHAVDDVDLRIPVGETLGLVGESGSGKSTLGRIVLRMLPVSAGQVVFEGQDITNLQGAAMRRIRRDMQMVFQDPYASLDPMAPVHSSIGEPLRTHLGLSAADRKVRVRELLSLVGLSPSVQDRYPQEFSGGQLQRVAVARAIALRPKLLVLDEPVSSLDVSTQADVINLLADLQGELGLSYLFIAHDLAVVRHVSNRIAVMYLGEIVEEGPTEAVYTKAKHPYTQALLSAIPVPDPVIQRTRVRVIARGEHPSPANPPAGCRFHTRCPHAMDVCRVKQPPAHTTDDGATVRCHLFSSADSDGLSVSVRPRRLAAVPRAAHDPPHWTDLRRVVANNGGG